MEKIEIKRLVSATMAVDNSADADRQFDISAQVTVEGVKAVRIEGGHVLRRDANEMHPASDVADFQRTPGYRQIATRGELTTEEDNAIRDAINAFIADVEAADYSATTNAINN